jgi:nucleoside-diphosphate-sugar epimerase
MPRQHDKILVFGGSGQIGTSLRFCASVSPSVEIRTLPWSTVETEKLYSNLVALRACIEGVTKGWPEFDIVFASGLTDPRMPAADLTRSNVTFPLTVIEATRECAGIRYLTIGTVFEEFSAFASANLYAGSKRELCERLLAQEALTGTGRAMHLRLHTVYGGQPKPYMFFGQMIEALRQGTEFRMSSGQQFREYHHAHDIAGAILAILSRDWQGGSEPLNLSSGAPVRLADLARSVFAGCGRSELLKIGAIVSATGDNRDRVFPRSDTSLFPYYRDPIVGVLEYVLSHCAIGSSKGVG